MTTRQARSVDPRPSCGSSCFSDDEDDNEEARGWSARRRTVHTAAHDHCAADKGQEEDITPANALSVDRRPYLQRPRQLPRNPFVVPAIANARCEERCEALDPHGNRLYLQSAHVSSRVSR